MCHATIRFSCYILCSIWYDYIHLPFLRIRSLQTSNTLGLEIPIRNYDKNYGHLPSTYLLYLLILEYKWMCLGGSTPITMTRFSISWRSDAIWKIAACTFWISECLMFGSPTAYALLCRFQSVIELQCDPRWGGTHIILVRFWIVSIHCLKLQRYRWLEVVILATLLSWFCVLLSPLVWL